MGSLAVGDDSVVAVGIVAVAVVANWDGGGRNWASVANLAVAVVCVPVTMLDRVDGAIVGLIVDVGVGRHAIMDAHVLVRAALWAVDSLEDGVLVEINRCHVMSIVIFVLEDAVGGMVSSNVGGVSIRGVLALVMLVVAVGVLVWGHIFAVVGAAMGGVVSAMRGIVVGAMGGIVGAMRGIVVATMRSIVVAAIGAMVRVCMGAIVGSVMGTIDGVSMGGIVVVERVLFLISAVHVLVGAGLWAIDGLEDGVLVEIDWSHVVSIVVFVLKDAVCRVIGGNVGCVSVCWVPALVVLVNAMSVLIRSHVLSIVVRAVGVVQILLLFGSSGVSGNGSKGERSHF